MKLNFKSLPWIFLVVGFAAIATMTYIKSQTNSESYSVKSDASQVFFTTLPQHYSEELNCDNRIVFISKSPITFAQFQDFVWETDYMTWRESNMRYPNWRFPNLSSFDPSFLEIELQETPTANSAALWLTTSDAKAYCKWVASRQNTLSPYDHPETDLEWELKGCRLPTTDELDLLYTQKPELFTPLWEWTTNSLHDVKETRLNAKAYKTAWKPNTRLRHRRVEDLSDKSDEITCFRVAWTVSDID